MAGEAVVGLVVLAGQAGELALGDADSSGVGSVAINANCANVVVAFFASVRADHALIVVKLKSFSAGSALGDVGGLAVRATVGAASAGPAAGHCEALPAGNAGVCIRTVEAVERAGHALAARIEQSWRASAARSPGGAGNAALGAGVALLGHCVQVGASDADFADAAVGGTADGAAWRAGPAGTRLGLHDVAS